MHQNENGNKHSTEWLFRDLNTACRLASDAAFAKFGVREFGQPIILFMLERYGKDGVIATQKELAQRMRVSPTTITISLKSLERLGCIRKINDKKDMRRNQIEITEKGKMVAKQCRKAFEDLNKAMYQGFAPEERELINSFFIRMTNNLINAAKLSWSLGERNELDDKNSD
ncbi:MAG TPA: winged helix-turn-helix transcriptional regulator [Clostridiales bacterium]|nr:winged helix-turn-helix transcriptional regulator [Clostridiales bacterium]